MSKYASKLKDKTPYRLNGLVKLERVKSEIIKYFKSRLKRFLCIPNAFSQLNCRVNHVKHLRWLDSVLNRPSCIPKRSWIIVAMVVKEKRMPYLVKYEFANQNNLSLMKMV